MTISLRTEGSGGGIAPRSSAGVRATTREITTADLTRLSGSDSPVLPDRRPSDQ
jgi:hypothetical protein